MKIRFLTIMVALTSMFAVQYAVAKSSSTVEVAKKKHHKKHMKQAEQAFSYSDGRLGV